MSAVSAAVREQGIVAIVRAADAESAARDVATLIDAGLRVVEVSLVTPNALDVIRSAAASAPDGVLIGVGTAVTAEEVQGAARAGARFVVSPVLRERVLKATLDAGLEALPGVATPTEALQALEWGSTFVKLFPASLWSPTVLREVLTALPALQTVPTGGVTIDTAPEWVRAGAVAVGIGGALTRASDPAGAAHALLETIAAARA
ncbi:bifunctional 4-hydroxy-2-oxoglutarate aldolase/2-dehydro-3-deoxy-phosphogluconate aldolase [uncultured Amnibacterium sp.]|uniref:bifunctional 4-hydroxy-2-oxoglutarate aldolase/2-dehydro-3-deoxy-phosphogluconate aldolase n=1 Tax=uncultured Amnibacterium sp. TaxID=1631851 RepID=UPI0035CC2ABB